jgi:hypothetical protein
VILCAFKWHMFTGHDNNCTKNLFAWHFIPHGVCMAYVPMSWSQTVLNVSLNCKSHMLSQCSLWRSHSFPWPHLFYTIVSPYMICNMFLMMFPKFPLVIHLCSLIVSNMFRHMFLIMFPKFSYVIYSCSLIFRQYVFSNMFLMLFPIGPLDNSESFWEVSKRGAFWEQ